MKRLMILLFLVSASWVYGQVPYTKTEWCKAEGVEIIGGPEFPENHAVVAYGNFFKESGITSLEMVTPQLRKQMQKLAVAHHSCKIFVDFGNIVTDQKDDKGKSLNETYIYYYAIRPVQYLAKGTPGGN